MSETIQITVTVGEKVLGTFEIPEEHLQQYEVQVFKCDGQWTTNMRWIEEPGGSAFVSTATI